MKTLIIGFVAILGFLGGCGRGGETVTREDVGIGETPGGGTAITENYQMSNAGVGTSRQTVSSKSYQAQITVGTVAQQTATSSDYKLQLFNTPKGGQ